MRTKVFAANWKMNKTRKEAKSFLEALKKSKFEGREIIVLPSFLSLADAVKACKDTQIRIGAQNMHFADAGAFTGEVSPLMLKDIGVTHVLIGHSERRHLFKEDNALIQKKVASAISHGFHVIFCVGETLDEREQGKTRIVVREQMEALRGLKDAEQLMIAYEPVWAIGTGKTATPEQAEEVHSYIHMLIAQLFSKSAAEHIRILYGGSVTPENIAGLLAKESIDGALVGGASLDVKSFTKIAKA